jgi:serine/threonine-protein kinase
VTRPARPSPPAAVATEESEGPGDVPGEARQPRFSGLIATAAVAIGLCAGGLAGWAGRAPDVQALPAESSRRPPGLWIEPRWAEIPRQAGAEDQLRYAQFTAPRDRWAAAWLAVPGYHPRSHDATSKAYAQLARLWYRLGDVEALGALGSELETWKDAQKRDKDLAALIQLALDLKKGDLGSVEKGFEKMEAQVADMYEATLVALALEVCSDALQAVQRSGTVTIAPPLQRVLLSLVRKLNQIEIGGAGRANLGAVSAPRSKG